MSIPILVTSAGSGPAVAVIKALKSQNEIPLRIISVDKDPLSSGLYLSDAGYIVPSAEDKGYLDSLYNICVKENVRVVIPIFDTETTAFAGNVKQFKTNGIKVLVNDRRVVQISNDKLRTHRFCLRNGIRAPEIYKEETVNKANVTFPVVLKPRMGIGTKGIFVVHDKKELQMHLPLKKGYFAQKWIEGVEYTIDSISNEKTELMAVVPRERIVVKAGQMVKGRTVKDPKLINYGKKIAQKFGIKWVACSQCKMTKDGDLYFIEMNPRYGTGVSLSIGAGLNIPLVQIKLALSMPVSDAELDYNDNFYMMRYWEEIFRSKQDLYGKSR